jgi:hypothetical protein
MAEPGTTNVCSQLALLQARRAPPRDRDLASNTALRAGRRMLLKASAFSWT